MGQSDDDAARPLRESGESRAQASTALAPDPAAASPASPAEDGGGGGDWVFVQGPSDRIEGAYHVLRRRDDQLELGTMRAPRDGQPIVGELCRLRPRPEHDRLFDVEVLLDTTPKRTGTGRPAQVATAAYRANWDLVFGPKSNAAELN
jgi:hypothetical protein